ncbi:MAG TPA: ISKra4 family transposase [Candidatus Tectomicrobia bacterium]
MLCLHDSIRDDDPSMQCLLRAVEDAPSLTALILATWQVAHVLAVQLIEAVLAERARQPTAWPPCPACGASLRSKCFAQRQMMSLFGPIQWRRRVGRCPRGCDIPQVAPLDAALGVPPHQRTSGELQALGCALAVFVPFATAARLLGWYSGGVVSPRAVWCWVQAAGHQAMAHLQADLDAVAREEVPLSEPLTAGLEAAPLLMGADGVMVPFRPEGGHPRGKTAWHEVKVGVLARLGRHTTRAGKVVARLHQRRLVAVFGDIDALQRRLWLEALRQGIMHASQVVWLSDGARGLWRLFDERFTAYAIGVLDFYHAVQQLWKSAAAWLDGRTTQARRWFGWARHRLRHGNPDGVLADLADALEVEGLPATARDTVRTVYAYLERHHEHIDYAAYKALGLPLGSGMVESACKWLIQQRFKGVGMRWSEDGFNHLLHLRLAWVNGRFEALFGLALSPNS